MKSYSYSITIAGLLIGLIIVSSTHFFIKAEDTANTAVTPTIEMTATPQVTQTVTPTAGPTGVVSPTTVPSIEPTQTATATPTLVATASPTLAFSPPKEASNEAGPLTEETQEIYSEDAKHQCTFEEFSHTVKRGDNLDAAVKLEPSIQSAEMVTLFGDLPHGITADPAKDTTLEMSKVVHPVIHISSQAQKGSFNIMYIYKERQEDGQYKKNYCQLNLIVE